MNEYHIKGNLKSMMKNISDVNNIITSNYADCVLEIELRVERKEKQIKTTNNANIYTKSESNARIFEWSSSIEFVIRIAYHIQLSVAENMIELEVIMFVFVCAWNHFCWIKTEQNKESK